MRLIESAAGGPTAAAALCAMSLAQWSNLRDGVKDSKTGKRRGMRKETANNIANKAGKTSGWLDIDHSEPLEHKAQSPQGAGYVVLKSQREMEIEEIEILLRRTNDRGLAIMLDKSRDIASQYPIAKQTLGSSQ